MAGLDVSFIGPSGIDWKTMVTQLVGLEQTKITRIENEKLKYQAQLDSYGQLRNLLGDLQSKSKDLAKKTSFDLFTATSSDAEKVTMTGKTGSVDGQYEIGIYQLAATEKMISTDGKITSQSATLASLGITAGDISIGGTTITLDPNDTIQDVRGKINTAADAKGVKLPVTASVIKIADNNFRLVLAAKETGSTGVEYKDLTGSALQDLGIIQDTEGNKGSHHQVLSSDTDIVSAYANLAAGESISYSGKSRDGKPIEGSFIKTDTSTIEDFLKQVEKTFNGMVDASTDATGKLVITDTIAGTSRLAMSTFSVGSTNHSISTTEFGKEGAGVLSTGKDAYLSVQGIMVASAKNTVSGLVTGTTFELHNVTDGTPVITELKRDYTKVKEKVQALLDSYNSVLKFAQTATSPGDPKDKTSPKGQLAGDMTVTTILNTVKESFYKRYDILESDLTSFAVAGVKSNAKTGELSIDDTMLKDAFETNLDSLMNLFTTVSVSGNANVSLGLYKDETTSGKYELEEVDNLHARIRKQGTDEWITSDERQGDILFFSSGPLKGLSINAPNGSLGGIPTSFTFSKGLGTVLDEAISKLTSAREGTVTMRQEALKKSMDRGDQRITDQTERIEAYRLRLIKQFSKMESNMTEMSSQSSKMMSSLGYYNNNS